MDFINYDFNNLGINKIIKFYTYDKNDCVSSLILKNQIWEIKNTKIFINILKNNNLLFVDIGANLGWYSIISSLLNNKTISFEAYPETFYLFEKTNKTNNLNIDIRNIAISDKKKNVYFHYWIKKFQPRYIINNKYKNIGEILLLDNYKSSELIINENIIFNTLNKNIEGKYYHSVGIIINPNFIWKEINSYNELILKVNIRANNNETIGKNIKFYNGIKYIINKTKLTNEFQEIVFKCPFNPKNFINKNRIGIVKCCDLLSIEINNIEYDFYYNQERTKNDIIDLNEKYNYGGNYISDNYHSHNIKINANSLDNELSNITQNIFFKIDIEGHEPYAINGMKKLLDKNIVKWIILEFSPNMTSKNKLINDQLLDMCNILLNHGFLIIPINNIKNTDYDDLLNDINNNNINIHDIKDLIQKGIQVDLIFYKK